MKLIDPKDLQLVSLTQAASILGVHRDTVEKAVSSKRLPAIDLNRGRDDRIYPCLRIKLSDLKAFIEKRVRNKTEDELEAMRQRPERWQDSAR
jgi:excisionase family DNA binding protein